MTFGDHARIDCFSLLSAGPEGMRIGRNVHLAAGVYLFGSGGRVVIEDFAGLSARTSVYTATDDFKEGHLTGPTIPLKFRKVTSGAVLVGRHVIVGTGTVIMPGVTIGRGAAVGAQSFVRKDVAEFEIVAGNPLRLLGVRDRRVLELEQQYLGESS
jgi:dTDP-4-amino-4,6-dideoxy-D-glucose acyltransferase